MHRFSKSILQRCTAPYNGRSISTIQRPETIYALSTSPGKAGVAVIRISGRSAKKVMCTM